MKKIPISSGMENENTEIIPVWVRLLTVVILAFAAMGWTMAFVSGFA